MIDLKKFCRKSHYEETLTEPFSDGGYTYAADGSILIRVDKIPEIIKIYPSVRATEIFEENKINGSETWIDPPMFIITERDCSKCKGTGKIHVCDECNGLGSLEFSSDYNDYDVECKSCYGKDTIDEKCEDCEGIGRYKEYPTSIVKRNIETIRLNGISEQIEIIISGMYLEMIQDLPNIKIALQGKTEPIKLKFDGGIGLLMPMEN